MNLKDMAMMLLDRSPELRGMARGIGTENLSPAGIQSQMGHLGMLDYSPFQGSNLSSEIPPELLARLTPNIPANAGMAPGLDPALRKLGL